MNIVSGLAFALCFLIVASCWRRGADYLSPARVFGFVWCAVIGLTHLKLSRYQFDWPAVSWVIVLLGPLAFLLGVFAFQVQALGLPVPPIERTRLQLRQQVVDGDRLFYATVGLAVLFFLAFGVVYSVTGYVPLLSRDPAGLRSKFTVFGVGVLINSVPVISYLTLSYHLYCRTDRWKRHLLKVLAVVSLLFYLTLLQRFQIVMALLMGAVSLYYGSARIRLRALIVPLLGVVGVFYWISTLRAGQLIQAYSYVTSKMKFPFEFAILTEPYMYIAMNLENFAHAAGQLDQFTFGYYTLDFTLALTGLKHWLSSYFALESTPHLITSSYNTYTAFWTYYRDFGAAGMALGSFVFGFAASYVHASLRRRPTPAILALYSVFVFVMVMSFFNSPVSFLWFAYNMAGIFAVLFLVTRIGAGGSRVPNVPRPRPAH